MSEELRAGAFPSFFLAKLRFTKSHVHFKLFCTTATSATSPCMESRSVATAAALALTTFRALPPFSMMILVATLSNASSSYPSTNECVLTSRPCKKFGAFGVTDEHLYRCSLKYLLCCFMLNLDLVISGSFSTLNGSFQAQPPHKPFAFFHLLCFFFHTASLQTLYCTPALLRSHLFCTSDCKYRHKRTSIRWSC